MQALLQSLFTNENQELTTTRVYCYCGVVVCYNNNSLSIKNLIYKCWGGQKGQSDYSDLLLRVCVIQWNIFSCRGFLVVLSFWCMCTYVVYAQMWQMDFVLINWTAAQFFWSWMRLPISRRCQLLLLFVFLSHVRETFFPERLKFIL